MSAAEDLFSENYQIIDSLKETTFFQQIPEDLILEMIPLGTRRIVKVNDVLITQGRENKKILFLLSGKLDVFVSGEIVTTLDKRGDVVGEMGLINEAPASATIRAAEAAVVFEFDRQSIVELGILTSGYFQAAIYKRVGHVLSDRLKKTNEKAKSFERTARQLEAAKLKLEVLNQNLEIKVEERTKDLIDKNKQLESKNEELVASMKRLEEVHSNLSTTLDRVAKLYDQDLPKLDIQLESTGFYEIEKDKDEKTGIRNQIRQVIEGLSPLMDSYRAEMSLSSKKVLLLEKDRKQQTLAKLALGGTGVELHIVDSIESAMDEFRKTTFDMLVLASDYVEFSADIHQMNPELDIVLTTSEELPVYVDYARKFPFIRHVIVRNGEDRTFTLKSISTTVKKLTSNDVFGLGKYLSWGVETHNLDVYRSDQRTDAIEQMEEYFSGLGIRKSVIERCSFVSEELLMNAIYDAPVDECGESLYNHMARTDTIILNEDQKAQFSFACDGILAAVSVKDPFGALDRKTVLDYLVSCYSGNEGRLNDNKGGAGRGLHQLIEASDLVVFNVRSGFQTEVIALFNVDMKVAKQGNSPSFHFFDVK